MAYPSESFHHESLLEYANGRMDREMATSDKGSRTEDVDLTHSTYELTRDLGHSAFRDKISVLNITDAPLAVLVLPLSHGDETVGSISARLATSESAQIRWAMQEDARRGLGAVHSLSGRSDLVLYDSLNVTVSEVLVVVTHVYGGFVSVLDVRRVSATENLVLAILPGLLLEGSGTGPVRPGGLMKTIVEEVLERMAETPGALEYDAVVQPPIKVHLIFASGDLGSRRVKLDVGVGDTIGSIRDRLGAHGVERGRDMYICHNGKLLPDDYVLSDLEFWEYKGLSAEQEHLVLLMYLLPGRAQGRLSHIPESGKSFDRTSRLAETKVSFTWKETPVLFVTTHPLRSVRHLKMYAIRENIALRAGWHGMVAKEHSNFFFSVSSHPLEDENCPLEMFSEELLRHESKLCVHITAADDEMNGYTVWPAMAGPGSYGRVFWASGNTREGPTHFPFLLQSLWPWKRLCLPLEERDFDGKDLNDFDVRTFKKYSSRVIFVNRTSRPVHISCFTTWSTDRRVRSAGINVGFGGLGAGATREVGTTLRYLQGYGAVDDPCLKTFGSYETVNIANGMVRELSVVFGVESLDGSHIEYKRMKNVKGGQQVDVLKAFVDKMPKYTHPAGQPSKDALAAHFLPTP